MRLLYRFYDVTGGKIRIDGQNIANVTQSSLRREIGIVPQDTALFNETIEFNIAYGKEGATQQDVIRAAKEANLHDRIMSFKDGYRTVVGERGMRLSGGERQRLSLARILLKDPTIILLDEATSALDSQAEKEILESLLDLTKGRTSLTIAHRLSTIASCDVIMFMQAGKITERSVFFHLMFFTD